MSEDTYGCCLYTPDLLPQVLDVMSFLWEETPQARLEYFRWKYTDNPNVERPLGIVALWKGRVVGFRGYFATRFEIPDKTNNLVVLVAGDTCVHSDHRHKGLSVLMGNLAMDTFSGTYRVFLNMTATAPSLPGYLKLGFQPLAKKAYISHASALGMFSYFLTYKKRPSMEKGRVVLGSFDPLIISDRPKPEEMEVLCARQASQNNRIRLAKNSAYFQWRFKNPIKKYLFYYYRKKTEITGYLAMGLSPNFRRGYILDYADANGESVEYIIRYMIQHKHFDILSIYDFCLDDRFRKKLGALGFKISSLVRSLERKKTGELPMLIRPVRKNFDENDWMIEGLDIRKIENWQITEICSDAV